MARAKEIVGVCLLCQRTLISKNFQPHGPQVFGIRRTHKYKPVPSKQSRFATVYRDLHGAIEDNSTAHDFVFALKPNERTLLFNELRHFEEEKLRILEQNTEPLPPTPLQRRRVLVHNALPFIGFGFLDNFLMITSGEYIDSTFGVLFGISTMAAAGLGNWISDLAGVGSAHYIEQFTSKCGVKSPALTAEQVDMKETRWSANMGRAIGISIGCVLGMFPLLFFGKKKHTESEEQQTESEAAVK
ncbi:hypothetical protein ScPMuIL_006312 [Solemya velum]